MVAESSGSAHLELAGAAGRRGSPEQHTGLGLGFELMVGVVIGEKVVVVVVVVVAADSWTARLPEAGKFAR